MTDAIEETIRVWHPDGREHKLTVKFAFTAYQAEIEAVYQGGSCLIKPRTLLAHWMVTYEPRNEFDTGQLWLGNGRIDLEVEALRGIGIGSLLMLPLVRWAKERPGDVPVVPISLAGPDADTEEKRCRRNRFYEKLGFVFDYNDEHQVFGEAREMPVSKLITPVFKMSGEWQVESLSSTRSVF